MGESCIRAASEDAARSMRRRNDDEGTASGGEYGAKDYHVSTRVGRGVGEGRNIGRWPGYE